jgi:hypothetical protein
MDTFDIIDFIKTNIINDSYDETIKNKIIKSIDNTFELYIKRYISNLETKTFHNKTQVIKESVKSEPEETTCKITNKDTHINYDKTKCLCRVFKNGLGGQCNRNAKEHGFCNAHYKKYKDIKPEYGLITEERPTHELSGKKKDKFINWKSKEVKINKSKINNIDKKSDDLNEESELLSNLKLNEIELESDDEEIEIDEEIQIDGIVYEQAIVDSNICLYKDGINVATWDGKNNSSIEWKLTLFKKEHEQKKI